MLNCQLVAFPHDLSVASQMKPLTTQYDGVNKAALDLLSYEASCFGAMGNARADRAKRVVGTVTNIDAN